MAGNPSRVPFELPHQLWPDDADKGPGPTNNVPGQPCILLSDREQVLSFLFQELSTERLDRMYPMLFLVSKRNNIKALHHQAVKGRQILITERPDLHLIWYYDRIFIKPIPLCLLNYGFYASYLLGPEADPRLHEAACGFLRTYAGLIVHETDFKIAKRAGLLPVETDWEKWCHFMKSVSHKTDAQVARRYHYGEMRLTRLNFYSKVFFFGWSYLEVYHQYVDYFARFLAPYLFLFGAVTVILAAMQTALTADPDSPYKDSAYWFCPLSVTLTVAGLGFFPLLYLVFQIRELFLFLFYRQKAR